MNVREMVRGGGELVARQLVPRLDEAGLERVFAHEPVVRALAGTMARRYRPEVVPGFSGLVLHTLTRQRGGPLVFTLRVIDGQASAALGPPEDGSPAAVRVMLPVADFIRIAAGVIDPAEPLLQGRATFTGELGLAARLPEMFGMPKPR